MSINSEVIYLMDARLSYAHLWHPKKFDDSSKPRFECAFLLDPEDGKHAEIIKGIEAEFARICIEQWGSVPNNLKGKPFGLADEMGKEYDGWQGLFYISANCRPQRPKVVDRNPKIELSEEDGRPYAGCYVNGTVQLWADARKAFGPRVNGSLRAVQFLRDGESFTGGGPIDASNEFEDVSAAAEDSSFLED